MFCLTARCAAFKDQLKRDGRAVRGLVGLIPTSIDIQVIVIGILPATILCRLGYDQRSSLWGVIFASLRAMWFTRLTNHTGSTSKISRCFVYSILLFLGDIPCILPKHITTLWSTQFILLFAISLSCSRLLNHNRPGSQLRSL